MIFFLKRSIFCSVNKRIKCKRYHQPSTKKSNICLIITLLILRKVVQKSFFSMCFKASNLVNTEFLIKLNLLNSSTLQRILLQIIFKQTNSCLFSNTVFQLSFSASQNFHDFSPKVLLMCCLTFLSLRSNNEYEKMVLKVTRGCCENI